MCRVIRLVAWGCGGFAPTGLRVLPYLCTPKIIGLVAPMPGTYNTRKSLGTRGGGFLSVRQRPFPLPNFKLYFII